MNFRNFQILVLLLDEVERLAEMVQRHLYFLVSGSSFQFLAVVGMLRQAQQFVPWAFVAKFATRRLSHKALGYMLADHEPTTWKPESTSNWELLPISLFLALQKESVE